MKRTSISIRIILSLLLTLTLVIPFTAVVSADDVYDGTSVSAALSGDGSETSPYLISSGADLAYFAANAEAGKCYKLTENIVWSSYTAAAGTGTTNWTPVAFSGTFDGDGHYIAGLYISGTSTTGTALFSTAIGTIKNLTIKDSYFEGATYVAALVGALPEAAPLTIENCVNYADIVGTSKNSYIGGFMGNANKFAEGYNFTFRRCVNYGSVTSKTSNAYAGGIVGGGNAYNFVVEECANFGNISGVTALVGGIMGQIGGSSSDKSLGTPVIRNCVNYGAVSANRMVGGITGRVYPNAMVANCVNYGEVTAKLSADGLASTKADQVNQWGGVVGNCPDNPADRDTYSALGEIANCFYLNGCAKNSSVADAASYIDTYKKLTTGKDAADMTVSGLGLSENIWTTDAANGGRLTLVYLVASDPVTPEDTTAEETTPAETTPAETTPVETTPVETTPVETPPVETTPADTDPAPSTGDGNVLLICAAAVMAVCALAAAVLPRRKAE